LAAFGVYSPDGRMIAFRRSAYDGSDVTEMTHGSVWVARAQGQDPWPLRSADSMSQIDPEALWPAWSPDGKQIAYEPLYGQGVVVDDLRGRRIARFSGTDPSWIDEDTLIIEGYEKPFTATDLLVVDPATGESRPLFALEGHQSNGEVSPDGTRLVYQGGKLSDGPPQIYVLEADGTQRQLTDMPGGAGDPTWSPNGRRIAFVSPINFDAQSDIYVVDADGGDITKLAGTTAYDAAPDWSPDGDEVAFHAYADEPGMPSGIWVASAGDGSLRQLTANGVGDGDSFPVWSPGGGWIAFLRYENAPSHNLEMDDSDFWLMRPDGRGQHRLVAEEGPLASQSLEEWMESTSEWGMSSVDNHFQGAPTWSPDGRRIAWSGGHCDCITIVDVASGKILDTRLYGDFGDPSWSPDGIVVSEPMLVK
jgi:Tol biopolymer transport system component